MRFGRVLIVPAAGTGSRLGGSAPKLLHPVNGVPMLDYLLGLYGPVVDRVVLVVSPLAERAVGAHCSRQGADVDVDVQPSPTGMLDAILVPHPRVRRYRPERIWISWCDQVAVHPTTVRRLAEADGGNPEIVFPTAEGEDPYIHLVREEGGRIARILQRREGDAMPARGESDMGLFSLSAGAYLERLLEFAGSASAGSATGERNFLPFIPWLAARGTVLTFPCTETIEAVGINTPHELRLVEEHLRHRGAGS